MRRIFTAFQIFHKSQTDVPKEAGGGPALTNCQGVPWSGNYVTANGDLTVDFRSNIASESRAKIVNEYLLQFTEDPQVKNTLRFLMTREITHFQQFTAALETIEPNFPPGILQGDPHYTHVTFNLSRPDSKRGPWNEGQGSWPKGEEWEYVEDPIQHVRKTKGLKEQEIKGTSKKPVEVEKANKKLSKERSQIIKNAVPTGEIQWSTYDKK